MLVFSQNIHRNIYLFGLFFLVFCLPLSTFGTSISELIILGNWVLEGSFKEKIYLLKSRKTIWVFISIFVLHALWLLPPQDYSYAYNDLKIKVPILVLPILIGTSAFLSKRTLKTLLLVFVSGVLLGSFISLTKFVLNTSNNTTNYRELSLFISHIRFSLMVAFSVFILLYYCFINIEIKFNKLQKIIAIIITIWLIFFMFLLKSLTGIIVFGAISYILIIYYVIKIKVWLKWIYFILIITFPVIASLYAYNISKNFTNIENVDLSKVDILTQSGNKYMFDTTNKSVENGKFVWVYYCPKELFSEWTKRSKLPYLGKDINSNKVRYTIVRYLTSKGLKKDSVGISKLKNEDIIAIESGVANYIFLDEWKIYPLIYNVFWELYEYKTTGNASGHSIAQRIEYLKTAKTIIEKHFWFGVGTGNVKLAFDNQYIINKSLLDNEWRRRAHNQLITFLLTFGIFGFIWIVFAIFYPMFKEKGFKQFLFLVIALMMIFSFINEDTFETQAGVTFFVLFYSIFLFGKEKQNAVAK